MQFNAFILSILLLAFVPTYGAADLIMIEFLRSPVNSTIGSFTPPPVTPGSILQVTGSLKNAGNVAAGACRLRFYLSTDQAYNSNDIALGYINTDILAPNGVQYILEHSLPIPTSTVAGNYYVLCRVDADNMVVENNETNNLYNFPITIVALPDLIILSPNAPTTAIKGTNITLTCTVRNNGLGPAGTSNLRFYLSANTTYEATDILLGYAPVVSLIGGTTSFKYKQVTIPITTIPGNYYILYRADAQLQVVESNENNNVSNRVIAIQ